MATGAGIRERYLAAVHSESLKVDERTTMSDTDVLGAMGVADDALTKGRRWKARKPGERPEREAITPARLAVPLERLFAGDHNAVHELVRILSEMTFDESRRCGIELSRVEAADLARAVIAWFRHNRCEPCGGRGKQTIPGTPMLSAADCHACAGTGKAPLDKHFRHEWKPLVRWMRDRMEIESGRAAPQAMRSIRERMDF